ncbi:MAG: spore coat U domain-containing protein [Methylobacter sp.]|jgi:spore coat protein U-like protein
MNKLILLAAALLLNMLWPSKASALVCNVSSTSVAFGSFSPLTGNTVDSTGTISISCVLLTSYTITLSPGGSGSYTLRRMANGGNFLYYNLYLDAGYNQTWGNGTGGSSTVTDSFPLRGGSRDHTVYGRIPLASQRNAMVGSYSDSITVTIFFL